MRPYVGARVLFVRCDDTICAAIITDVSTEEDNETSVSLYVMPPPHPIYDNEGKRWAFPFFAAENISFSAQRLCETWHWPIA